MKTGDRHYWWVRAYPPRRVKSRTPRDHHHSVWRPIRTADLGEFDGSPVVFLPRHGGAHTIPPHRVNYRANLWALKHAGVENIIGMAAVGGITDLMPPGVLCIPDQVIDYTWGREHTLFADDLDSVTHIDFSEPYCTALRAGSMRAGRRVGVTGMVVASMARPRDRGWNRRPRSAAWRPTAATSSG